MLSWNIFIHSEVKLGCWVVVESLLKAQCHLMLCFSSRSSTVWHIFTTCWFHCRYQKYMYSSADVMFPLFLYYSSAQTIFSLPSGCGGPAGLIRRGPAAGPERPAHSQLLQTLILFLTLILVLLPPLLPHWAGETQEFGETATGGSQPAGTLSLPSFHAIIHGCTEPRSLHLCYTNTKYILHSVISTHLCDCSQKQQAAHQEEKRRREKEWELKEKGLAEREERLRQAEEETRRRQQELLEEREMLQRKKEDYQRELERLREAQRRLERDKEALRRDTERLEATRRDEVRLWGDFLLMRSPHANSLMKLLKPNTFKPGSKHGGTLVQCCSLYYLAAVRAEMQLLSPPHPPAFWLTLCGVLLRSGWALQTPCSTKSLSCNLCHRNS